jgi:hypothetical protein
MEYQMVIAPKSELHRLVEAIPDTRPDLAEAMIELGLRLLAASRTDEVLYRRLSRELADAQSESSDPSELDTRVTELQSRWLDELGAPSLPLPSFLESAPLDDEPLTPEEATILEARRASLGAKPPITHDEREMAGCLA